MFVSRRILNKIHHIKRSFSSSSNNSIISEQIDGINILSFNRPPVSSINIEFLEAFSKVLDLAHEEKSCKGIIFTSTSQNAFSAGLDMKALLNYNTNQLRELRALTLDCCSKLYGSSLPTAAAINGHAIGGGCFFAMLTEYRVMVKGFKIGLNETQLGIAMPEAALEVCKNIISPRHTEAAFTLATIFNTEEAHKLGLVDDIAEDKNEAIQKSLSYLKRFNTIPSGARAQTKNTFRKRGLELFNTDREGDINNFVNFVQNPETQKQLSAALKMLRK